MSLCVNESEPEEEHKDEPPKDEPEDEPEEQPEDEPCIVAFYNQSDQSLLIVPCMNPWAVSALVCWQRSPLLRHS